MKETKQHLEQFQREIAGAERMLALWRPFNAPVPVLFDALKKEANLADNLASKLEKLFAEFESGQGSVRDMADDMKKFAAVWQRCQELHAALHREQEIAQKNNPMLGSTSQQ